MVPHHLPELSDFGCYFPCPVAYRQSAREGVTPRLRMRLRLRLSLRLGVRLRGKQVHKPVPFRLCVQPFSLLSDKFAPQPFACNNLRVEGWTCYPCLCDWMRVRGFTFVLLFAGLGVILREESRMKQYSSARSYSCSKPPAEHSLCLYD